MRALAQLRLLLWKNTILKLRRPVITAVEITIPVVLFLLLAFVRTRSEPELAPETLHAPLGVPSSGTVNFMQSLLCGDIEHSNANLSEVSAIERAAQILLDTGIPPADFRLQALALANASAAVALDFARVSPDFEFAMRGGGVRSARAGTVLQMAHDALTARDLRHINLASHAITTRSSKEVWTVPYTLQYDIPDPQRFFFTTTALEKEPWIEFDLAVPRDLRDITISLAQALPPGLLGPCDVPGDKPITIDQLSLFNASLMLSNHSLGNVPWSKANEMASFSVPLENSTPYPSSEQAPAPMMFLPTDGSTPGIQLNVNGEISNTTSFTTILRNYGYSATLTAIFRPPMTGKYQFSSAPMNARIGLCKGANVPCYPSHHSMSQDLVANETYTLVAQLSSVYCGALVVSGLFPDGTYQLPLLSEFAPSSLRVPVDLSNGPGPARIVRIQNKSPSARLGVIGLDAPGFVTANDPLLFGAQQQAIREDVQEACGTGPVIDKHWQPPVHVPGQCTGSFIDLETLSPNDLLSHKALADTMIRAVLPTCSFLENHLEAALSPLHLPEVVLPRLQSVVIAESPTTTNVSMADLEDHLRHVLLNANVTSTDANIVLDVLLGRMEVSPQPSAADLANSTLLTSFLRADLATLEDQVLANLQFSAALVEIVASLPEITDPTHYEPYAGISTLAEFLCAPRSNKTNPTPTPGPDPDPTPDATRRRENAEEGNQDGLGAGFPMGHGLRRLLETAEWTHVNYAPAKGEVQLLIQNANRTIQLMSTLGSLLKCFGNTGYYPYIETNERFVGYPTEWEMMEESVGPEHVWDVWAAIVFHDVDEQGRLPDNFKYSIRMEEHKVPDTARMRPSPFSKIGHHSYWRYYWLGFSFLQDLIDRAFIELRAPANASLPNVFLNEFPTPAYVSDFFTVSLGAMMPLLLVLAWVYSISIITKDIVYEKELRLRQALQMMGLPPWIHHLAWFIMATVQLSLSSTLLTIILFKGGILINSDPFLIWCFLVSYSISSIALAFLISSLFSRAKLAAACAGIFYFLLYLPYVFIAVQEYQQELPFGIKWLSSLSSTTAFGLGCGYMATAERNGDGALWSNWGEGNSPCDLFSLKTCMGMLFFDAVFYFILTWYIETVWPGEYGIPQPPYFFLLKSYWKGAPKSEHSEEPAAGAPPCSIFEPNRQNAAVLLAINNIVKTYSGDCARIPALGCGATAVRALKGVSFSAVEGEITALLGHNGAGKSTLMSILTGLFPATSGSATINGLRISDQMDQIRQSLGFCPQHNVLWENLTCAEHLRFSARLKGMENCNAEVDRYLADLRLLKQRNVLSKHLSGGQKRLLSVAMAFIGGSKVIILDEPSAGMDPSARRRCWDLLLSYRTSRSILISTHYMDEADVLGDRIAVIGSGKLCCFGSSLFLKRQYQLGYRLIVSMARVDVSSMLEAIRRHVPRASLAEIKGTDVSFFLPANDSSLFAELLEHLDEKRELLGVLSYGISAPSLEDVFLEAMARLDNGSEYSSSTSTVGSATPTLLPSDVAEGSEACELRDLDSSATTNAVAGDFSAFNPDGGWADEEDEGARLLPDHDAEAQHRATAESAVFYDGALATGIVLLLKRFWALFVKRFHHAKRDYKAVISQVVLPALFISVAMTVATSFPAGKDKPAILLDTSLFDKACADHAQTNRVPVYDAQGSPESQLLKDSVFLQGSAQEVNINSLPGFQNHAGNFSEYLLSVFDSNSDFGALSIEGAPNAVSNLTQGPTSVRAWFDSRWLHAMPVFQNLASNTILRAVTNSSQLRITTYNHPLNKSIEEKSEEYLDSGTDITVSIFIIIAMSFVPASFVVFLVAERASKAKHLQFVSGANPFMYWLANYLWDMLNYLIPALMAIAVFYAFQLPAYTGRNFSATCAILYLYGFSVIPMMYPASFVFSVPSTAYISLICANLFVGLTGTLATFVLDGFPDDPVLSNANHQMKRGLLVFPTYCLGRGIINMARNEYETEYAELVQGRTDAFTSPFDWDISGKEMAFMAFEGPLYLILIWLLELALTLQWKRKMRASHDADAVTQDGAVLSREEDDDVARERALVQSQDSPDDESDVLLVKNLTKRYSRKHERKTAVDQLCFHVANGECFGLLGVNGAGKTSTFKMLTGDTRVTSGQAWVCGHSVLTKMQKVQQSIGYVPQFDALNGLLTGSETLYLYARLRGIPERRIAGVVREVLQSLRLTQYASRPSQTYSGGNKRKLSVALALLGNPRLLFLDEPSAGLDPGARRFLWNVVLDVLRQGRSVLLTSHSMDECEALCTRLAIMVNGQFECLGSPQHLKSKFGDGYTLVLQLREAAAGVAQVARLKKFVHEQFPGADLQEAHTNYLSYHLPNSSMQSLAATFRVLESCREEFGLTDYMLSQTSLDAIFCKFAARQDETLGSTVEGVAEAEGSGGASESKLQSALQLHDELGSDDEDDELLLLEDTERIPILSNA
eukprot:m.68315 g.68315  ORF g.68315 m.68315 type:complete len:2462 (-) comp7733_c0_seq1:119-7504(-)